MLYTQTHFARGGGGGIVPCHSLHILSHHVGFYPLCGNNPPLPSLPSGSCPNLLNTCFRVAKAPVKWHFPVSGQRAPPAPSAHQTSCVRTAQGLPYCPPAVGAFLHLLGQIMSFLKAGDTSCPPGPRTPAPWAGLRMCYLMITSLLILATS